MEFIKVVDIINTPHAIIQKFGFQVFYILKDLLNKDQEIILSFDGIENMTSGFCNASVGNIYRIFPDKADKFLKFQDLDKNQLWKEKIDSAIYLAKNSEKSKIIDSTIQGILAS